MTPCPTKVTPNLQHGKVSKWPHRYIEEMLLIHQFRSCDELEATVQAYGWLCNQLRLRSSLDGKPPPRSMKEQHKIRLEIFKKRPCNLLGHDSSEIPNVQVFHRLTRPGHYIRPAPPRRQKLNPKGALKRLKNYAAIRAD